MRKARRIKNSLVAIGLSVLTAFSVTACNKDAGGINYAKMADVEFWSTYASESILQDLHGVYDDFKNINGETPNNPKIDLRVVGGEEEAAKIIMTTGAKPVKEFYAQITDLTSGQNSMSKDTVDIYQVLYTELGSKEFYKYEGFYPDGLAPIAGTKAVGENNIAKNSNQGLYISFNIPYNQPAGVYTGTFVISMGEETKNIPVRVEVLDAQVSEETHIRSSYSLFWGGERGELDTTQDMYVTYINALKEHRLGPSGLMYRANRGSQEEVDMCVKTAIEYCGDYDEELGRWVTDKKAISFGMAALDADTVDELTIVYSDEWVERTGNPKEVVLGEDETKRVWNYNTQSKYFLAMFYGCMETWDPVTDTGIDVFAKTFCKGIDEPELRNIGEYMYMYAYSYKQNLLKIKEEIENDKSISQDFKNSNFYKQLLDSMMKVEHICTSTTQQKFDDKYDTNVMEMTQCPHYNSSASADARSAYRKANSKDSLWWYGCDTPKAPYPSYHLGNHALSCRITGWMEADYDIQANLNWATNDYKCENIDGTNYMEDYYDQAVRCRSVPGEGWLFYPGKNYGVDGPIPTMRIKEYKNGLEEFELIYKLKELFAAQGYEEDVIMGTLYDTMYSGTKIYDTISCEIFASAREKLLDMYVLATSDANVMITDFVGARGNSSYGVFVADGYTLGSSDTDDVKVSPKFEVTANPVENGTLYNIVCKEENAFTLTLTEGEGSSAVVKQLSIDLERGTTQFYKAEEMIADVVGDSQYTQTTLETELVDATTINAKEVQIDKYAKLSIGTAKQDATPTFVIGGKKVQDINRNVSKVEIELYYTGTDLGPSVSLSYVNRYGVATEVIVTELKQGVNTLTISGIKSLNWGTIGKMQSFYVKVGKVNDVARSDIYLAGMTIYR